MIASKHTPGPWEIAYPVAHQQRVRITAGPGVAVASVHALISQEANARLIAAAPDLLAALEAIVSWSEDKGGDSPLDLDAARAAIKSATGSEE